LFAQQISGDAGVHSTAHAKKDALFHFEREMFDE
jgi:hypothetical protein